MKIDQSLVAKIENEFVLKAHYALSSTEQKIILFLASRINPQEDEEFHKQVVTIKSLEELLSSEDTKKWGSAYRYLKNMCKGLLRQTILFKEPIVINEEKKVIEGGINWFQHILIIENEQGQKSIEFMFSNMMKPFLLELKRYVRINALEIMELRGKHSIRMYQIFKAERERTKKYKAKSILLYEVGALKSLLGIDGKYQVMSNFRRRVLEPLEEEINKYSQEIFVKLDYIREGRKVSKVRFTIWDGKPLEIKVDKPKQKDYIPSEEDVEKLTNAKYIAYQELLEYGVKAGIAYKQIIPDIKAGDIHGFEDIFVKQALAFFDHYTNLKKRDQKAGAFVIWWTQKAVFSPKGDIYWKLHEKTYQYKKSLDEERKGNRHIAKDMDRNTFLAIARKNVT